MGNKGNTTNSKRLLSVIEVVQAYGGTPWMWRNLIWNHDLPVVKVGRKFFLDRNDIEQFITRNKESYSC